MEGCECRIHRLHRIWDLYQQVDLRCSGDPEVLFNINLMAVTWRCEGSSVIREALVVYELLLQFFFGLVILDPHSWRRSWAFLILGLGEEQAGVHIYGQIFKDLDLLHQVTLEELEQGSWPCFSYRSRRWARDRDHSPEGFLCTGVKIQTPVEVCLLLQSPSCRKVFLYWTRQRFMSLVVHHLRFGWIVICMNWQRLHKVNSPKWPVNVYASLYSRS